MQWYSAGVWCHWYFRGLLSSTTVCINFIESCLWAFVTINSENFTLLIFLLLHLQYYPYEHPYTQKSRELAIHCMCAYWLELNGPPIKDSCSIACFAVVSKHVAHYINAWEQTNGWVVILLLYTFGLLSAWYWIT